MEEMKCSCGCGSEQCETADICANCGCCFPCCECLYDATKTVPSASQDITESSGKPELFRELSADTSST